MDVSYIYSLLNHAQDGCLFVVVFGFFIS